MLRDLLQEVRELGLGGTLFRVAWEAQVRSGVAGRLGLAPPTLAKLPRRGCNEPGLWPEQLRFPSPEAVAEAMTSRLNHGDRDRLFTTSQEAAKGRILCFGRWMGDYGSPIEWHLNPQSGAHWDPEAHWTGAPQDESRVGDVKLTWEVARFPHAYAMARAAALFPDSRDDLANALATQIEGFLSANPWGRGVHWSSGQEIVLRLMAWLFSFDVLLSRSAHAARLTAAIGNALVAGAVHVERHLDYARCAVYNNHLLFEALCLLQVGALLPSTPDGLRWRRLGWQILEEEAERQFYADGAYIQQSHNYHRVALQGLVWACLAARMLGDRPAPVWIGALERSLDFLVAHQNPVDGRLPNYGSNDGALPSPLSCCDFADFRPTLQAVSLLVRGERLYPPGPWDEEAAWLLGPKALDAPLRPPKRQSGWFAPTGYQVLRGQGAESFCTLRCGSLHDRFSQIDMLHLDVWWRGQNVLVDGGSYLYNASPEWHEHFFRTGSHNTLTLDGRDQMLHHRRFKVLYWTQAKLLDFNDTETWAMVVGEHYGYRRHSGHCVHRRAVLFLKDDVWVVADTVIGQGMHEARLHWLCGDFPHTFPDTAGPLIVETSNGPFSLAVYDSAGLPIAGEVARGQELPPRGWLSRYYAEKVPVASYSVERAGELPMTFLSVFGGGSPELRWQGDAFEVRAASAVARFRLREGFLREVSRS